MAMLLVVVAVVFGGCCGSSRIPEPSPASAGSYYLGRSPMQVAFKDPHSIHSGSVPRCTVRGNPEPILIAPVVAHVTHSLASAAPHHWTNGHVVFVIDATAEWPQYTLPEVPVSTNHQSLITRARDRPTLAIDARSQTGILYVSGPGIETTFYCLEFDSARQLVTVDKYLQLVSD